MIYDEDILRMPIRHWILGVWGSSGNRNPMIGNGIPIAPRAAEFVCNPT
jgi:hypothetical protein